MEPSMFKNQPAVADPRDIKLESLRVELQTLVKSATFPDAFSTRRVQDALDNSLDILKHHFR
jgi:hypothetical protein